MVMNLWQVNGDEMFEFDRFMHVKIGNAKKKMVILNILKIEKRQLFFIFDKSTPISLKKK